VPATASDIVSKAPETATGPSLFNKRPPYTMRPTHPAPTIEYVEPTVVVTPEIEPIIIPPKSESPKIEKLEAPKVEVKVEAPKPDLPPEVVVEARQLGAEYGLNKARVEVAKEGAKAGAWQSLAKAMGSKPAIWGFGALMFGLSMSATIFILGATIDKTLEVMGFSKEERTMIYWAIGALIGIFVFYIVVSKLSPYITKVKK